MDLEAAKKIPVKEILAHVNEACLRMENTAFYGSYDGKG